MSNKSRRNRASRILSLMVVSSCATLIWGWSGANSIHQKSIQELDLSSSADPSLRVEESENNSNSHSDIKEYFPEPKMRGTPKLNKGRIGNLLHRVYGLENKHVRRSISDIEESSYRSQTGLRLNPDHIVPYHNHPYDILQKRNATRSANRNLQDKEDKEKDEITDVEADASTGVFRPIRITAFTEAMDAKMNDFNIKQISFLKEEVIPRTIEFWESALLVVPVQGNLPIDRGELSQRLYCGDSEFTQVPEEHLNEGVPDSDLVLYISAQPSTRFCGPSTLAVAVACNFDQFDRPTAGAVNFCLDQVELNEDGSASESQIQDNVDVAVHEAAHVLAMSSNSYRFFYDSGTGFPRTRRPFSSLAVKCVDGTEKNLVVPSESTLKFFIGSNTQRYASIVTPKVLAVARNQFNCQEMEGAPLENQPTGSQSCTGDHWEERLFYPEALSGVISPTTNILSPLTLALMEDSGWYMANYTFSQVSPWGHGAGCDFVFEKCITSENGIEVVPEYSKGYFCHEANARACSPAHTHKMACTVIDYSLYFPPNPPPPQFQYFSGDANLGGPRQADFCPVYGSTYSGLSAEQLDCRIDSNKDILNIFGEYYGEQSKCFETSTGEGRCYQAQCILSERVLKVNLRNTWETCTHDFEEISIKSASGVFDGTLVCPRLASVCPDMFCPANCAGRGEFSFLMKSFPHYYDFF